MCSRRSTSRVRSPRFPAAVRPSRLDARPRWRRAVEVADVDAEDVISVVALLPRGSAACASARSAWRGRPTAGECCRHSLAFRDPTFPNLPVSAAGGREAPSARARSPRSHLAVAKPSVADPLPAPWRGTQETVEVVADHEALHAQPLGDHLEQVPWSHRLGIGVARHHVGGQGLPLVRMAPIAASSGLRLRRSRSRHRCLRLRFGDDSPTGRSR